MRNAVSDGVSSSPKEGGGAQHLPHRHGDENSRMPRNAMSNAGNTDKTAKKPRRQAAPLASTFTPLDGDRLRHEQNRQQFAPTIRQLARGPRFESRCGQCVFTKITATELTVLRNVNPAYQWRSQKFGLWYKCSRTR